MATGGLDSQIKALLAQMQEQGTPPVHTLTPEAARATRNPLFIELGGARVDMEKTEDRIIPGPGGDIPVRLYRPRAEGPLPVLIYLHGGGWVIGNLDTHDGPCRSLAQGASCAVVSVDYRLAPEHKFPSAVEDAYAATCWVAENGRRINLDTSRVAVGGDSAGGNLAAVVCLISRDRGGPPLCGQLLVYPVTDLSSLDGDSYRRHGEGYMLTRDGMAYYRAHYLTAEADALNPYASPLLAEDLSGLPPACILTAEFDVLTDEAAAYAARLKEAGIPVRYTCFKGMIHAFFGLAGAVDRAGDALREAAAALRSTFAA